MRPLTILASTGCPKQGFQCMFITDGYGVLGVVWQLHLINREQNDSLSLRQNRKIRFEVDRFFSRGYFLKYSYLSSCTVPRVTGLTRVYCIVTSHYRRTITCTYTLLHHRLLLLRCMAHPVLSQRFHCCYSLLLLYIGERGCIAGCSSYTACSCHEP